MGSLGFTLVHLGSLGFTWVILPMAYMQGFHNDIWTHFLYLEMLSDLITDSSHVKSWEQEFRHIPAVDSLLLAIFGKPMSAQLYTIYSY